MGIYENFEQFKNIFLDLQNNLNLFKEDYSNVNMSKTY